MADNDDSLSGTLEKEYDQLPKEQRVAWLSRMMEQGGQIADAVMKFLRDRAARPSASPSDPHP